MAPRGRKDPEDPETDGESSPVGDEELCCKGIMNIPFAMTLFLLPAAKLLLSLAWVTVLLGGALGVGRWVALRFGLFPGDAPATFTALILQAVLGVGIVAQLIFLVAWAGIFGWPFVVTLLGIGGLLLIRTRALPFAVAAIRSLREIGFLLVPVAVLAAIPLAFCLVPEYNFDALRTHLWLTRQLAVTGHLPLDLSNWNLFIPNSAACWFSPAYLLTGETGAKTAHWMLGALTALLLLGGFSRRGQPSRAGCLAAALFIVLPVVAWEMSVTYVDLASTLFITAAMICLIRNFEIGSSAAIHLGALFAGAAIASKYNALLWLPFWLLLVAWRVWSEKRTFPPIALAAGRFVLLTLLVAAPWLIRNSVVTGNPLFPLPVPLLSSAQVSPELIAAVRNEQASFGCGHDAAAFLLLPINLTLHPSRFRGSPGVLPFLAVGALLVLWRRLSRADCILLAAFAFGLLAWFRAGQEIRYLLPLLPVASWLAVRPLQLLPDSRVFRGIWMAAILLQICVHFPLIYGRLPLDVPFRLSWQHGEVQVMTGTLRPENYLERTQPFYPVYRWANRHLSKPARILSFDACAYWSDNPILYAFSMEGGLTLERDPARLVACCRRSGLTHVVVDMNWLTPDLDRSKIILFFEPRFQQRYLRFLYQQGNVYLFAIP
jgi:hypothetical protein